MRKLLSWIGPSPARQRAGESAAIAATSAAALRRDGMCRHLRALARGRARGVEPLASGRVAWCATDDNENQYHDRRSASLTVVNERPIPRGARAGSTAPGGSRLGIEIEGPRRRARYRK